MATKPKTAKTTKPNRSTLSLVPLLTGLALILLIMSIFYWWHRSADQMPVACTTSNLKLTAGQQQGAAGTIYQHMVLTNSSSQSCSISGFPTAFLYGSNGYALGNGAAARPNPAPLSITLAPNDSANTVLGYPQAGNFDPGVCTATSTTLKLYPPSATTPLEIPLQVPWCPGFSESSMQSGN